MTKGRVISAILFLAVLSLTVLTACGGNAATSSVFPSKLVQANVAGETVSIPLADVQENINSKFIISVDTFEISFMAYQFEDTTQIRADICPPCRSESFTLYNDTLVCDTCGTVFQAGSGQGVSGPCVKYPKASVTHEVKDGNIVMNAGDLIRAYNETLKRD
jgi:nitrite reductase/ring-hydroxylating ferredoxin subunit